MKIAMINAVPYGSTGKIMFSLSDIATERNHEVKCTTGYTKVGCNRSDWFVTSGFLGKGIHKVLATITGYRGLFSLAPTLKLILKLRKFSPDVIHLHNLHGWYLNLPVLFGYIKKRNIRVIWTLHDCWSFTGQCPHFTMAKCDKWKTGCHHCKSYHNYPAAYRDSSRRMWKLKKKWFTGIRNLTIVTPSNWLADLVKQSYLKDYPVMIINNGIDLSVFKPSESNFRNKYAISMSKKILLGVSFGWGEKKGLDVFLELAKRLDNEKYQIVLVGTDETVDQQLSESIISIHRTQNQKELAEIYTVADLFVNPTREENYPTVNMESIACGTPVLTFRTGGSPEILDETCGSVVDCDDIDAMEKEIIRICENNPYSQEMCLQRAQAFDMHERFHEYIALYENCINKK